MDDICNFTEQAEGIILTGQHWVRQVSFIRSNKNLVQMYKWATEESQRYEFVHSTKFIIASLAGNISDPMSTH